nr:MAG TPA: hypothetical protein [Caudoviricetes sp.]
MRAWKPLVLCSRRSELTAAVASILFPARF